MAFLDNSGDIILDAVLTDTGRMRLARGDGSFKIAKFAFGDDEINYGEYEKNHTSGSAYYDLEILQTPILEAFTNNASSMKSKLLSISRTNLLYLPVIELNTNPASAAQYTGGYYGVAVDTRTEQSVSGMSGDLITTAEDPALTGFMFGANPADGSNYIRVDQGLDTSDISANNILDADLVETQYIVEIDNRLGSIVSVGGSTGAAVSFVDDDNIASYYLSLGTDSLFVSNNTAGASAPEQSIAGPRGTTLQFQVQASIDLNSSTFLFTELGSEFSVDNTYYYIDTTVRVTGATTGYRIDIPVRYVKYKS
tara:strand:- start:2590 stop:3519 length:930 start_codon:yes stop_codon:yes gene_type:complete